MVWVVRRWQKYILFSVFYAYLTWPWLDCHHLRAWQPCNDCNIQMCPESYAKYWNLNLLGSGEISQFTQQWISRVLSPFRHWIHYERYASQQGSDQTYGTLYSRKISRKSDAIYYVCRFVWKIHRKLTNSRIFIHVSQSTTEMIICKTTSNQLYLPNSYFTLILVLLGWQHHSSS